MVSNEIEVTATEERVLRFVEEKAQESEKVSVNDIAEGLKLSKSSIYASLYGRKNISDGLFKKLPVLRGWIVMVRRKKRSKYDVSWFLDNEAGVSQKKVKTRFK